MVICKIKIFSLVTKKLNLNTCNLQRRRAKMTEVIITVADIGRTVVSVVKIAYTIGTCKNTATRPAATANVSEIQIYNYHCRT